MIEAASTFVVFLCRALLATPVKALRVASARKEKRRERGTARLLRAPLEDEGVKKERGFLNEKYRVKLSLRLLLPNHPPSLRVLLSAPHLVVIAPPSARVASTRSRIGFAASRDQSRVDFPFFFLFRAASSRAEMLLV